MISIEKLNVELKTPFSIFDENDNVPFYVPIYQRKYNWTYENSISELIDDLEKFYIKNKDNENASYFLGNIITKAEKNSFNSITRYILVDGQQRLTTILIFIKYLILSLNNIKEGITQSDKNDKIKSLENMIYVISNDIEKKRVLKITNKENDKQLRDLFLLKNIDLNINEDIKQSNYYKNLLKIKERLNIKDINTWNKWLNIFNKIKLVQISLSKYDDDIAIFETINSKGLPLNILDLSKNYLFLIAESQKYDEDIKSKIEDLFIKLESFFSKNDIEKNIKKFNRFFAALITVNEIIDPSKETKELYAEFKKISQKESSTIEKFTFFINEIEFYIEKYIELNKLANDFKTNKDIKNYSKSFLANSKLDLYLPLFFFISKQIKNNKIDEKEENQIYELLDMHNLSLSVTNKINKDNRFIIRYIENVKGDIRYNSLYNFLVKENAKNKSRLSTRNEFINGLKNSNIYEVDKKIARYILYRIENYLSEKGGESIEFKYSIEHIFPLNPNKWKDKYLNQNQEILDKYVGTIGNLTLVKSKLNSKLSNSPWESKKIDLEKTKLFLNQDLKDNFDDWKIMGDDIKNNSPLLRLEKLISYIEKIWPIKIMDNVKFEEFTFRDYIFENNKKLTIIDAIKIVLFENNHKSLTLNNIKDELISLNEYIEEEPIDIIPLNKDKISTGGWMTERIYSNTVGNENIERFEDSLFFKDKNGNYKLTQEKYKEFKVLTKKHFSN